MQDIYETFEFNRILELIDEYSKTEVAHKHILSLKMLSSYQEIKDALEDLKEVQSIILRFGNFPIHNSADALELIEMAKKTSILTPRDLNLIANDVETMTSIVTFMKKVDSSYPRMIKKVSSFKDLSNLEKAIRKVITNALTVDDKASAKLFEIRTNLKKLNKELDSKAASLAFQYAEYLSDENPTLREGHFVLPVKTSLKSKVLGAIYDISGSGNTTFIEPLEIISLNNKITQLKIEENEEVRRILKELTSLVLIEEDEVIHNNTIIGEIDFISAKALFANENEMEIATLSKDKQIVSLQNARHPLLDKEKVISNSYYFDEEKRIVVISGPNAGGKTVSLKTVGIAIMMNQSGLAIPASKGTLGYFNHLYIDIGDNQSISDNLSTFSAHMSHIGEITSLAKAKDLILIDELGTGTDPKEGEALAIGVIKHLLKTHCFAFISSHFSSLKEFALTHPNLENSSMIFDENNLVPTYVFKMGTPGKSYGLEVASRYGINQNIIEEAKSFIANSSLGESDELISTLQKKVENASRLEKELENTKIQLDKERKGINVERKNLEERREKLLSSVEIEKQKMIDETKEKIDEIIKALSNSELKLHDIIELKHKVESLEEDEEAEIFNEEIKENDLVAIPSLDLEGTVKRIRDKKASVYTSTGFTVDIDISRLHKIYKEVTKSVIKTKIHQEIDTRSVPIELNLIGLHVDEAKEKVVKYIDDCRYKHMSKVRIIHGFGSGALRRMVHEYLKTQKDISFKLAEGYEGGGGATVVIFNER